MAIRMTSYLKRARSELRIQPSAKRVRARLGDRVVLDTVDAMLVWEPRRVVPLYAVPAADLAVELEPIAAAPLPASLPPVLPPGRFDLHTTPGRSFTIRSGAQVRPAAAFRPDDPDLAGRLVLDWNAFDGWEEEEQPVLSHPHDPFARIDILPGSRHVEVSVDETMLASSTRPVLLIETGLPVRYYLPTEDVRLDLLQPSESATTCAYKGQAAYRSYGGIDVAWTYLDPLPEAARIRDLVAFYQERSTLRVDGVVDHGAPGLI
jgi:uncharacterized protein (DUF427 family)